MIKRWHGAMLGCLISAGCAAAEPSGAVGLEPVVEGLNQPLFLTHAGDGSGRLYVVEKSGRILVLEDGMPAEEAFLDIGERVRAGGERGLLGLAFHPDFASNGRYFVNYTRGPDGATVVAEFESADAMTTTGSERRLLTIEQPYGNHNGGMIAFGPDGYLYIGMGDGGAAGDPQNRAQDPHDLLGKMLRIAVDGGEPYAVPADNPFEPDEARPEIFAVGLRNPWRFSFDQETGALYAGDVGQNAIEEIDVIESGANYGWRLMEGSACYNPSSDCRSDDLTLPIAEYANAGTRCSITGGYVYRGPSMPELTGAYVFGDYCSGEIMALQDGEQSVLLDTSYSIASFGEDEAGELYVVDHGGGVHRIVSAPDEQEDEG